MTDKEYREQRKRLQKLIDKWSAVIGLGDWDIAHYFFREPNEHNDNDPLVLATTNSRWEYKRVSFNWYLQVVEQVVDSRLELHVVHELLHPLIDPLHEQHDSWDAKKLEFVTQSVAVATIRAREAGTKDKGHLKHNN